jgi:predicted amidohydrolase YtcJ
VADLVILERSPLDDPEHINQIRVLETIVGGRTAYRDRESQESSTIRGTSALA